MGCMKVPHCLVVRRHERSCRCQINTCTCCRSGIVITWRFAFIYSFSIRTCNTKPHTLIYCAYIGTAITHYALCIIHMAACRHCNGHVLLYACCNHMYNPLSTLYYHLLSVPMCDLHDNLDPFCKYS